MFDYNKILDRVSDAINNSVGNTFRPSILALEDRCNKLARQHAWACRSKDFRSERVLWADLRNATEDLVDLLGSSANTDPYDVAFAWSMWAETTLD